VTPIGFASLLLDTGGILALARRDKEAHAFVARARAYNAELVVSWLTLAELTPGADRPAIAWALSLVDRHPVTESDCEHAARLVAASGMPGSTVDAVIAASALRLPRPVVVLTSDPKDMAVLLAGQSGIAVAAV
jgi:predicted nucleic acid-binding protein